MDENKIAEAKALIAQHEQENLNKAKVEFDEFIAKWQVKYGVKLEPIITINSNGK